MGNVGRRGEVTLTFRGGNSGSSSSGRLLNEFLNRKGFRPSFVHPLWLGMAPSYRWKRSSVFGESEGLAVVKREENNRFPRRASFEPPCHVDSLCAGGESQEEWQRRRRRGRGIFFSLSSLSGCLFSFMVLVFPPSPRPSPLSVDAS